MKMSKVVLVFKNDVKAKFKGSCLMLFLSKNLVMKGMVFMKG